MLAVRRFVFACDFAAPIALGEAGEVALTSPGEVGARSGEVRQGLTDERILAACRSTPTDLNGDRMRAWLASFTRTEVG
jgi:hypothetical protein